LFGIRCVRSNDRLDLVDAFQQPRKGCIRGISRHDLSLSRMTQFNSREQAFLVGAHQPQIADDIRPP